MSSPTSVQQQITNEIYPPVYGASLPYATPQERSDLAVKEYLTSCNPISIAKAYQNQTQSYIFDVAPAIHAQDLAYTCYPNDVPSGFYPEIAVALQDYLTTFGLTGDPNKQGLSPWSVSGSKAAVTGFTKFGATSRTRSDSEMSRCAFWNQAAYYPEVSVPNT